jgi:hypothetical protein
MEFFALSSSEARTGWGEMIIERIKKPATNKNIFIIRLKTPDTFLYSVESRF